MREHLVSTDFFLKGKSLGRAIARPFQKFAAIEASSGLALLAATLIGFIWANSSAVGSYHALFEAKILLGIGTRVFDQSVHFWINDGLMTVFFFLVGLEIKYELLVGELSSFRRAILPAVAALGGMIVPAGLYAMLNHGTVTASGWAVPMATDIAFVVGALALVGRGLPPFLPVFLVSLAIFDDLGAVAVIALFYGGELHLHFLLLAGVVVLALALLNVLGFRNPLLYVSLGIPLWVCTYLSGIHPTVSGVIAAFTIPARSGWDTERFADAARSALKRFTPEGDHAYTIQLSEENRHAIEEMETLLERVEPPLQRIERFLHPYVSFGVMPLFALANCGITLDSSVLGTATSSVSSLGIFLGLFIGKQTGIFLATWLFVRSGLGEIPGAITWSQIYGGALLCGIGFTMSLFIADLSFTDRNLHEAAKISILVASLLSGVVGMFVLSLLGKGSNPHSAESPQTEPVA